MLFFFVVCSFSGLSSQTENPLITEVQLTKGDSTYRYLYLYNENNAKSLETKYVLVNKEWKRREQTEWFYQNGLCTEQHIRTWKDSKWDPTYLIEFQYVNNDLESETHYDTQNSSKQKLTRTEFTYSQGKKTSKSEYNWVNNAWRINSRLDFTYNTELLMDTIFQKEYTNNLLTGESKTYFIYNESHDVKTSITLKKDGTEWINSSLSNLYYKPHSRLKSSEILKEWNPTYGIWSNAQNVEYFYNSSQQLVEENYQYWDIAFWVNDLRYRYEYDSSGILLKKTTFLPIYNDYRPAWSINYSEFQNSKARLIESRNEFWGGEKDSLINTFIPYQFNNETVISNGSSIRISYIPIYDTSTHTTFGSNNHNQIQVYPNPSKGIFYFDSEKYDVSKWIISDLSGKTILSKELKERSGVIDLGDFNSGVYILQVFTPEGVKTQKLIKEVP